MTQSAFRQAVEDIIGIPRGTLQDSDSRESLDKWDSLADVQILLLIQSEYGFEPDAELVEAETAGQLMEVLSQKGAF